MKNIQLKVPGKLYIAGEYAVVEPGYSAIVTTVDLFLHLKILQSTEEHGSIFSKDFTSQPLSWRRVNQQVQLDHPTPAMKYILAAIHTVENYVQAFEIPLCFYQIEVTSELDSQSGQKFGLGSSGAVTVGIVRGLLQFYGIEAHDLLVYKLSVLAQLRLGINSSFGDLAAITYTGWIKYTSFDRAAVSSLLRKMSEKEVVESDWPDLNIERLNIASDVQFLIGWTGSPASSDDLVGNVQKRKQQSKKQYQYFLDESQVSVDLLNEALKTNNAQKIKEAVESNRQALLKMGQQTNVLIETPQLTKLCDIAKEHGGIAKTSGAGGGDSGIAFVFEDQSAFRIIEDWKNIGITNLPLSVYNKEKINGGY